METATSIVTIMTCSVFKAPACDLCESGAESQDKMVVGKTSTIAAGVCGALFLGYCIYFDRKRRSDPNFKNRLREKRRKQKIDKEKAGQARLPDLKDPEAVQKFFLEEIQFGEKLLA